VNSNGQDPQEEESQEPNAYRERSDRYNTEYRREYQAWYASLPFEERQSLKKLDLDHALIDYHANESSCDISERQIAIEEKDETLFAGRDYEKRLWEAVEGIAILIIDAENIRLEADTLAFMAGFHTRMGRSGTELAGRYGLTRAAWSKRCKYLQRKLGLPPSRFMKSEEACKVYAKTNGRVKVT
jgi:hypothetical protein